MGLKSEPKRSGGETAGLLAFSGDSLRSSPVSWKIEKTVFMCQRIKPSGWNNSY